jgi:hypothetical protein
MIMETHGCNGNAMIMDNVSDFEGGKKCIITGNEGNFHCCIWATGCSKGKKEDVKLSPYIPYRHTG